MNQVTKKFRTLAGKWSGPAKVLMLAALLLPMIGAGAVARPSAQANTPTHTVQAGRMLSEAPCAQVQSGNTVVADDDAPAPTVNWSSAPPPVVS